MKPSEVLQRHVDLAEALQEMGLQKLVRDSLEYWLSGIDRKGLYSVSSKFLQTIALHVASAHTYSVSTDMNDALYATANTYMNGTETSSDDPPPQGCGVAFFDEPLRLPELRGRTQLAHVLSWGRAQAYNSKSNLPRTLDLIVLWNDVSRAPDGVLIETPEVVDAVLRRAGGFSPIMCMTLYSDQRVGPRMLQSRQDDIDSAISDGADPDSIISEGPNVLRWALALWRLLNDTIAVRRESVPPPERAVRRRAQRARLAPCVEVVTLRREARQVLAPGSGRPLQWRSPVPGHWHTYWVGPGRTEKVRRWVAYHERGPEGAPYKARKGTVHRLAR